MSSLISLRIELPSHAYSFAVSVPVFSDVTAVKQQISIQCPGGPNPDGQRLIWRGRILSNTDKVDQFAQSPTLHLAVHPSAWTSQPPVPPAPATAMPAPVLTPPGPSTPTPTPSRILTESQHLPPMAFEGSTQPMHAAQSPLVYIRFHHQNAVLGLLNDNNAAFRGTEPPQYAPSKVFTKAHLERMGWSWPTIFDEDYPPRTPGGVQYQFVVIDGQTYLSLVDDSAEPTPFQIHALKILSYTFPLLSVASAPTPTSQSYVASTTGIPLNQIPPHVNRLLHQLGLPTPRPNDNNANPIPFQARPLLNHNQIQNRPPVPIRPLIFPLLFLLFRTVLLLYFFAPARQPAFLILFMGWMVYEGYRVVQAVFGLARNGDNGQERVAPVAPQPQQAPPVVPNQPQQQQQQQPRPPLNGNAIPDNRRTIDVLDTLSLMNISEEDAAVEGTSDDAPPPPAPTLKHRLYTFVSLFALTFHPAIWDRRRTALRQREGRIRAQAAIRNAQPPPAENDGDANAQAHAERQELRTQMVQQHARRPAWVREYIQRVVDDEWVDEAD